MSFRYLLRDDPAPEQRGSLACEMGRRPGVPRSRLARARLPEGIRRRRSQLRHLETATGNAIPPISVRSLPGMRTMPRRTLTGRRDAKPIEHEEDHTVAAAGQLEA